MAKQPDDELTTLMRKLAFEYGPVAIKKAVKKAIQQRTAGRPREVDEEELCHVWCFVQAWHHFHPKPRLNKSSICKEISAFGGIGFMRVKSRLLAPWISAGELDFTKGSRVPGPWPFHPREITDSETIRRRYTLADQLVKQDIALAERFKRQLKDMIERTEAQLMPREGKLLVKAKKFGLRKI